MSRSDSDVPSTHPSRWVAEHEDPNSVGLQRRVAAVAGAPGPGDRCRRKGAVSLVQLSMVGLMVRDMAASLEFYGRLGLDVPEGSEAEAFVEVRMESGVTIFFDTVFADKYDPDRKRTKRRLPDDA